MTSFVAESPRLILSDNGTEFNNSILEEIRQEFSIKKCNIVPHSPSSNGKVERCKKRIHDVLRYITEAKHSWDEWLPPIACSINSAINESSHLVLFGKDKRLPYEFLHGHPRSVYNMNYYVKLRLRDFQAIHSSVHDCLTASQSEMLDKQHRRAKANAVEVD